MSDILFIADFFVDQVVGGGELSNESLMDKLRGRGYIVRPINSHRVGRNDILQSKSVIVSNFINLSEDIKKCLESTNYVIYEHDHKYLRSRDPSIYPNFLVPNGLIINKEFYRNAIAVLCQSTFHAGIVKSNLQLDNIISLGGNLWSDEHFLLLEQVCREVEKKPTYAIMQSNTPHKNTHKAIQYCEALGLDYVLIPPSDPATFLRELGSHSTLIFFPKTPETLSRIVVEARMMGMNTKTTNNIGAIHEEWFSKKGLDLIKYMRYKQEEIVNVVLENLNV